MSIKNEVIKAVQRRYPRFVPVRIYDEPKRSDLIRVKYHASTGFHPSSSTQSEWGFVWKSLNDTMGQVKEHCLKSWNDFPTFSEQCPDPYAQGRFEHISQVILENPDKYFIGSLGITGFNMMTFIRGFDNFLSDLYLEQTRVSELADIVFEFEKGIISGFARCNVDSVAFHDDWGTQRALMVNPELWRDFFKPRYRDQFEYAHSLGLHVLFHSCGYIMDIIPDLIEIGVDILNLNQVSLMGIDELASRFAGKVCFLCPNDNQCTMPTGDLCKIEAEARKLIDAFGRPSGGFIAQVERYESMQFSEEAYEHSISSFRKHGNYDVAV